MTWIGVEIQIKPWQIIVTLPLAKLQDLDKLIREMLSCNVVSEKELRSFAGKCSNIATVLYVWRPFLSQLWAALAARDSELTNAPPNCIWIKQIETTLFWIQAFIHQQSGAISRVFALAAFTGHKAPVEVTTDASVWGIGGYVSVNNVIIAYFSDIITPDDERILKQTRGDNLGQQVYEGLALLVAVRLWSHLWRSRRVRLILRSDNVGALSIYSSVKGRSEGMNLLAREYALDMGECSFEPDIIEHLPGITNVTADALSRKTDPAYKDSWKLPTPLAYAKSVTPSKRDASWWKSIITPSVKNTLKRAIGGGNQS